METTKFFEVLETLRRRDEASPTGYESDRAFAERLGVANKTITLTEEAPCLRPKPSRR